jgi:hypothetical protein
MHLLYMYKILKGDSVMSNMVLRLLPNNGALSSEGLNTTALKDLAGRIQSGPGSGRKVTTGRDAVDAGTVVLVGAIDKFSKGPHQASLYNSRHNMNREIMHLEDAVKELDNNKAPTNKREKKKRGRKRRHLVTQLQGEKQSLLYGKQQVATMEDSRETPQDSRETPPDSHVSTPNNNYNSTCCSTDNNETETINLDEAEASLS